MSKTREKNLGFDQYHQVLEAPNHQFLSSMNALEIAAILDFQKEFFSDFLEVKIEDQRKTTKGHVGGHKVFHNF